MRKIINHHIEGGTRESHPRVQDLQHPRLGKPRRGLQILDTRKGFPRPSLNVVLDYINLGKKQKRCSLWCPWSQVQQDTSGPDNFRILGCLWTIHHRCTWNWDWTEMLTVSFPLRAKPVSNPLRINSQQGEKAGDYLFRGGWDNATLGNKSAT